MKTLILSILFLFATNSAFSSSKFILEGDFTDEMLEAIDKFGTSLGYVMCNLIDEDEKFQIGFRRSPDPTTILLAVYFNNYYDKAIHKYNDHYKHLFYGFQTAFYNKKSDFEIRMHSHTLDFLLDKMTPYECN